MHKRVASALCFKVLGLLMLLYPQQYRRKYAQQIRLTTTDMLQSATTTTSRILIWVRLYADILKSAGMEHYKRMRPRRFILWSLAASTALIAPLALACARLLAQKTDVLGFDGRIYNQQHALGINWYSGTAFILWAIVLPILSALLAGLALAAYYAHKRSHPRAVKSRVRAWGVVCLIGLFLLSSGLATAVLQANRVTAQKLSDSIAASESSQQQRPTLACKLLPIGTARTILGKTAYMVNADQAGGYSGVDEDSDNADRSTCSYYVRTDQMGISISVDRPKNAQAMSELKHTFELGTQQLHTITLAGHEGYYAQNGSSSFTLGLWMDDLSLTLVTQNFEHASGAVDAIVQNLEYERAYAQANVVQVLPASIASLRPDERDAITTAVLTHDSSIPAGTTYDIQIETIVDNHIQGTFWYGNGIHGRYTAEKRRAGWAITSYVPDH